MLAAQVFHHSFLELDSAVPAAEAVEEKLLVLLEAVVKLHLV